MDELTTILNNYGIVFSDVRGDGLYREFYTSRRGDVRTRCVALRRPVTEAQIRTLREHFGLSEEDGTPDHKFFGWLADGKDE